MIFSKFFHLSREGSKTIMQAGIWLAVFNLAALLPVVLLAMISEDMMAKHFAGDGGNIPLLPYAAALLVILTVMFLTYKVAYHKEYLTSGQEEYKLRMELADKLRRLPLSFFGLRDLSDVTGIIMDDVQTMSHVLSQSAAELIGGILTGIVALVVLFIYDWRLALYAQCLRCVLNSFHDLVMRDTVVFAAKGNFACYLIGKELATRVLKYIPDILASFP